MLSTNLHAAYEPYFLNYIIMEIKLNEKRSIYFNSKYHEKLIHSKIERAMYTIRNEAH